MTSKSTRRFQMHLHQNSQWPIGAQKLAFFVCLFVYETLIKAQLSKNKYKTRYCKSREAEVGKTEPKH